jgi:hypothetical protein
VARPRNPHALIRTEVGFTAKTLKYLDMLKEKDGFGASRPEVIRYCVWQEIHRLIEAKRLPDL